MNNNQLTYKAVKDVMERNIWYQHKDIDKKLSWSHRTVSTKLYYMLCINIVVRREVLWGKRKIYEYKRV